MIAPKSREIPKLQENISSCPQNRHPFAIGQGSECGPPETPAMPAQSFAILGIAVELQIQGNPIAILDHNWIAKLQRITMRSTTFWCHSHVTCQSPRIPPNRASIHGTCCNPQTSKRIAFSCPDTTITQSHWVQEIMAHSCNPGRRNGGRI